MGGEIETMKVIKNINNNVAVCLDRNGNELIAFGKGLGFKQPPYVLEDLSVIHRTYYNVDVQYLELLKQLDPQIFDLVNVVIDYAYKKMNIIFDNNIAFTLSDHIQFAIQRYKKGLQVKYISYYDMEYMNEEAVEVGKFALKQIQKIFHISLPYEEAYGIAIHLLNAGAVPRAINRMDNSREIICEITKIIEDYFKITIDKKGFHYSRFVSHMEYLFKRSREGVQFSTLNQEMFEPLKIECPEIYECAEMIKDYLEEKKRMELNEEEILYLMLHINRLRSREDEKNAFAKK